VHIFHFVASELCEAIGLPQSQLLDKKPDCFVVPVVLALPRSDI
jgi:hypothetical protein